jgi:hypothetical protein
MNVEKKSLLVREFFSIIKKAEDGYYFSVIKRRKANIRVAQIKAKQINPITNGTAIISIEFKTRLIAVSRNENCREPASHNQIKVPKATMTAVVCVSKIGRETFSATRLLSRSLDFHQISPATGKRFGDDWFVRFV